MTDELSAGALPDFVIIGAMKCGTTSLHYYLGGHPEISMSRTKELNFFSDETNWTRGVAWYRSQFQAEAGVRGEASPIYTDYPFTPHVPQRMHAVIPDVKLIYVVRDPIQRILSHYVHAISSGEEVRPICEALLGDVKNPYIGRSRYFTQIEQYLAVFPLDRLLVISQESLLKERVETLRRVFRFLGVNCDFRSSRFDSVRHKSSDKRRKTMWGRAIARLPLQTLVRRLPSSMQWHLEQLLYLPFSESIPRPELDVATQGQLRDLLEGEVRDFRQLTGLAFPEWSL